jgi:hypothetical protein
MRPPPKTTSSDWQPLDFSGLVDRLQEAKALLEQAAALAAVHDAGRLTAVSELQRRLAEEDHADAHRRRYR